MWIPTSDENSWSAFLIKSNLKDSIFLTKMEEAFNRFKKDDIEKKYDETQRKISEVKLHVGEILSKDKYTKEKADNDKKKKKWVQQMISSDNYNEYYENDYNEAA